MLVTWSQNATNFEVNHEDADLHTVTVGASPTRPAGVPNQ